MQDKGTAEASIAATIIEDFREKYGGTAAEIVEEKMAQKVLSMGFVGTLVSAIRVVVSLLTHNIAGADTVRIHRGSHHAEQSHSSTRHAS